jgi:hypothetical protein
MKIKLSHLRRLIRETIEQLDPERQILKYFESLDKAGLAAGEGITFPYNNLTVGAIDRYDEEGDRTTIDYMILDSSGVQLDLNDLSDAERNEIQEEAERQLSSY